MGRVMCSNFWPLRKASERNEVIIDLQTSQDLYCWLRLTNRMNWWIVWMIGNNSLCQSPNWLQTLYYSPQNMHLMGQLNLIFGWIYFHAAKPTAWFYTMDVTRLSTVDGPLHARARLHVTSLAFHSDHMARQSLTLHKSAPTAPVLQAQENDARPSRRFLTVRNSINFMSWELVVEWVWGGIGRRLMDILGT